MSEWKLREEMCEIGRRVYAKGFAAANDGNISYRLGEDRVLCTPTRVSKGFMKPDDLCIVDMDGKQVSGKRKRSSEILLHLAIMKARPDVKSCVHCHPPHATAFAVAHEPIPKCTMPEFEVFLGEVAHHALRDPRRPGVRRHGVPYVKDTDTIILANHGTITAGSDLEDAYFKTEIIDAYCRILILAKQLGTRELLLRRQGRRADQAQAEPRHPRRPAREGPGELRPLRQQPLPRGLHRLQARAPGVHPGQAPAAKPSRRRKPRARHPPPTGRPPGDVEALVKSITDQVMAAMNGKPRSTGIQLGRQGRRPTPRASRAASEIYVAGFNLPSQGTDTAG